MIVCTGNYSVGIILNHFIAIRQRGEAGLTCYLWCVYMC